MERAEWLEKRRAGITSTDVATIVGQNPWSSPWEVFGAKLGHEREQSTAMKRGQYFEDGVARWYADETGRDVRLWPGEGTYRLVEGPQSWMLATPDRAVYVDGEIERGLEIKTARETRMEVAGMVEEYGETGSDLIPPRVAIQARWCMAVCDVDRWDVAAYFSFPRDDFRYYHLERDLEIEAMLIRAAFAWCQKHIVQGEPLDAVDGSAAARAWLEDQHPKILGPMREATLEELELLARHVVVTQEIKRLKSEAEKLENQIAEAIGSDEGIRFEKHKATWKLEKGRANFETKRFREDHPDIAAQYTKKTPDKRRVRVSFKRR
jgi:putative phage-type endonuclease